MKTVLVSAFVGAAFAFKAPLFYQCNQTWASNNLGTCDYDTICSSGSALCSVAEYIAFRGWGGNPASLNSWLVESGGYVNGCNFVWASVDSLGAGTFANVTSELSFAEACAFVEKNYGLVAANSAGHYALVTGCSGTDTYEVNDPAYGYYALAHDKIREFVVYV